MRQRWIGRRKRRYAPSAISAGVLGQRIEPLREREAAGNAVADGGKVARPAAADHEPRQRARQVGRGVQQSRGSRRAGDASATNIATASSRCAIASGSVSGAASRCAKQPRARRRHGAVDGGEQRAAPLARRACAPVRDWRASPGSIGKRRACGLAQRRRQRRALAELRALHIGDAGGGGGQFQPRQRAERLGGGDREIIRQPPLGGGAVEHVAGQRRHRRQRAQKRRQLRVGIERVGDDDLARLEPRDLGGEPRAVAFGDAEFAGGDVDPGQREAALLAVRRTPRAGDARADNCCAWRRAACLRSACRA